MATKKVPFKSIPVSPATRDLLAAILRDEVVYRQSKALQGAHALEQLAEDISDAGGVAGTESMWGHAPQLQVQGFRLETKALRDAPDQGSGVCVLDAAGPSPCGYDDDNEEHVAAQAAGLVFPDLESCQQVLGQLIGAYSKAWRTAR